MNDVRWKEVEAEMNQAVATENAAPRSQSVASRLGIRLAFIAGLFGCASKQSLETSSITILGPGVINDPRNKSLRFDIMKFGLGNFCSEMMARGVALKLTDDHPVAGRFFGRDCQSDVINGESKQTFVVRYSGLGYVWTNMTQRVGFEVLGSVELLPDFRNC